MKKNFTLITYCVINIILWLVMSSVISFAQTASTGKTSISLLTDDAGKVTIKFEAGSFIQKKVNTPAGEAVIINIDKGTSMLEQGFPDLPKLTASIIVPDDKNMAVSVTESQYADYENVIVAPSKGSLNRDVDPATVAYTYGEVYSENNFFPKKLAALREPYILRDFRGQTVIVYPFQYNAVTKTLRVYSEITVTIIADAHPAINALHRNP
ncbi:MAG: C25 family peptidase propeptide domain-containing protein, partial [Chitinophagales bacterium]